MPPEIAAPWPTQPQKDQLPVLPPTRSTQTPPTPSQYQTSPPVISLRVRELYTPNPHVVAEHHSEASRRGGMAHWLLRMNGLSVILAGPKGSMIMSTVL